jgi:hypothetical protein
MKTREYLTAALLVTATPMTAFAATGARADGSGLVVWLFLGFCALIVLLQLAPAIAMIVGLAKGAAETRQEMVEETVDVDPV